MDETLTESWEGIWSAFVDTLAIIDWFNPWTWLVIVAGVAVLTAANR